VFDKRECAEVIPYLLETDMGRALLGAVRLLREQPDRDSPWGGKARGEERSVGMILAADRASHRQRSLAA
jgi:hypothetical protein